MAAGTNPYCVPSGTNGNVVTMQPPWNQDATHDQITCFDCHSDIVTDPDGTLDLISVHGGSNQRMLRGLELLGEVKRIAPWLPVLVMTSYGNIPLAVKAVKAGANSSMRLKLVATV